MNDHDLPQLTWVRCDYFPTEICISCGPDHDRFLNLDEPIRRAVLQARAEEIRRASMATTFDPKSPIEAQFWAAHHELQLSELEGLVTQHLVTVGAARYTLDFALVDRKIAIELDGYAWHSSRAAWAKDRRRDLALGLLGWVTYRFDGSLVHNSPTDAVRIAAQVIERCGR